MIVCKNKYNELAFSPLFTKDRLYFYKILNPNLAKEGEDWDFSLVKEIPTKKVDVRGRQIIIRLVNLERKIINSYDPEFIINEEQNIVSVKCRSGEVYDTLDYDIEKIELVKKYSYTNVTNIPYVSGISKLYHLNDRKDILGFSMLKVLEQQFNIRKNPEMFDTAEVELYQKINEAEIYYKMAFDGVYETKFKKPYIRDRKLFAIQVDYLMADFERCKVISINPFQTETYHVKEKTSETKKSEIEISCTLIPKYRKIEEISNHHETTMGDFSPKGTISYKKYELREEWGYYIKDINIVFSNEDDIYENKFIIQYSKVIESNIFFNKDVKDLFTILKEEDWDEQKEEQI